jgi:hypothetical protein
MKFDPGLYVSQAMEAIGIKDRWSGWLAFTTIALPIYLVGTLGLRMIGMPGILNAVFRPNAKSALRFVLGVFVVIGILIALMFSITPAGWTFKYNPVSGTFLIQSKYVAWIFAVEVLQALYRWTVARGISSALVATGIATIAAGLSVPSAAQQFIYWRNFDHLFGNAKPFGKQLQSYDAEILAVADFLTKDARAGDVVLCGDELLAPIVSLTNCRVPLGLFAQAAVARSDFTHRESAVKQFWKDWRLGNVLQDLLREAGVRYIVVRKGSEGLPATIPAVIANVFENSEFAVFKVNWQQLSDTHRKAL